MSSSPTPAPHRGSYRDTETHSAMLRDVVRTTSYAQAIGATVDPGGRVIDFGSGTGTLAIFASRCGAGRVDAIERETIVSKAREIARLNDCPNIHFHHGDSSTYEADEKSDLIISEWMGHCLFEESMLEPLILLRNRWLKSDGVMVPKRVSVHAALVIDEEIHIDTSFLRGNPYGIDYSPISELPLRQSQMASLDEKQIMKSQVELCSLDMKTVASTPERMSGTLTVEEKQRTYGLLAWFDANLDDKNFLGTGPRDAPTHWQQIFFPFPEPLDVCPSRPLDISLSPPRSVEDAEAVWSWRVSDGSTLIDVNEKITFAATASADPVSDLP